MTVLLRKTYYQDTDSIHLNYDDVDKVADRFKENGQGLIGKYYGNFHIDFKMAGARKSAEIYGIESVVLGKGNTYIF